MTRIIECDSFEEFSAIAQYVAQAFTILQYLNPASDGFWGFRVRVGGY